jgi:hypothetical protein
MELIYSIFNGNYTETKKQWSNRSAVVPTYVFKCMTVCTCVYILYVCIYYVTMNVPIHACIYYVIMHVYMYVIMYV